LIFYRFLVRPSKRIVLAQTLMLDSKHCPASRVIWCWYGFHTGPSVCRFFGLEGLPDVLGGS